MSESTGLSGKALRAQILKKKRVAKSKPVPPANPVTVLQSDNSHSKSELKGRADHLKKHQFKPGKSGNPKGRPKGETLEERVQVHLSEVPSGETETRIDLIARQWVEDTLSGTNEKLKIELFARLWPKPIKLQGDSEQPIQITGIDWIVRAPTE